MSWILRIRVLGEDGNAIFRTLHSGSVSGSVATTSSRGMPRTIKLHGDLGGKGSQYVGLDAASKTVGEHH